MMEIKMKKQPRGADFIRCLKCYDKKDIDTLDRYFRYFKVISDK